MGMYDYIYYKGEIYQTKAFDCTLSDYYIDRKKLYVKPSWLSGKKRKRFFCFTGTVNFYEIDKEYTAVFKDGHLKDIRKGLP